MCNLCRDSVETNATSRIQGVLICKACKKLEDKLCEIIETEENISKETVLQLVKDNEKIKKNISGKKVMREIYVPGKIVNLVI